MKTISFPWVLAAIWTIIILIGCSMPSPDLPKLVTMWHDKTMHILIFAPFGALWLWAGYSPRWVFLAGLAYGILIEVFQALLPTNRLCEWEDAAADTFGVLVGILAGRVFLNLIARKSTR